MDFHFRGLGVGIVLDQKPLASFIPSGEWSNVAQNKLSRDKVDL